MHYFVLFYDYVRGNTLTVRRTTIAGHEEGAGAYECKQAASGVCSSDGGSGKREMQRDEQGSKQSKRAAASMQQRAEREARWTSDGARGERAEGGATERRKERHVSELQR